MRTLSLCSGVGGIDLAFDRAGMTTSTLVEIDPKAQAVLRRYWPHVPIHADLKDFHVSQRYELVVGGTPCQDLSVAGFRVGLDGERSSLFYDFARCVAEAQPEWFVWENVAGALNSGRGRDMGVVLATMADLGYGWAYRVLDAQYFGVAQRRRRVVIVGRRGDHRSAAKVLALGEGVSRNPRQDCAPRPVALAATDPETGAGSGVIVDKHVVHALTESLGKGGPDSAHSQAGWHVATFRKSRRARDTEDYETWVEDGHANTLNVFDNGGDVRATTLIVTHPPDVAGPLTARYGKGINTTIDDGAVVIAVDTKAASPTVSENVSPTLRAMNFHKSHLNGGGQVGIVTCDPLGVRRLTPRECERLNGFPDDWTKYGFGEDFARMDMADSHRYRFMGNSVAVPVFEWLGRRIMEAT